jgi:hypothetical protein
MACHLTYFDFHDPNAPANMILKMLKPISGQAAVPRPGQRAGCGKYTRREILAPHAGVLPGRFSSGKEMEITCNIMYNIMMTRRERITPSNDERAAELRNRVAELEREIEYLKERATRTDKRFSRLISELAGIDKDAYKRIEKIAEKHELLVALVRDSRESQHDFFQQLADCLLDTNARVSNIEHVIFPNLERDMHQVRKIVPLADNKSPEKLDRRSKTDGKKPK